MYNVGKPPAKRRRVPYRKPVTRDSDETSSTASSSDCAEYSEAFEHGTKIIPHAIVHFTDQVMMGGTHHFHDTAANEASHTECVKKSGERSRIYNDVNASALNMLHYNMQSDWYQQIFDVTLPDNAPATQTGALHADLPESLQEIRLTNSIQDVTTSFKLLTGQHAYDQYRHAWDMIICEGVPVSVRELVSIFADFIGYSIDQAHYLLKCSWTLGWHVKSITSRGVTRNYWGGVTPGTTSNYLRGDWLETNITDVHNGVETSRLVRVICGVCVGDLENSGVILPDEQFETDENKRKNQVHFLLVRYAQKHPLSRGPRGPQHRPTCPGLLKDTHCLWEWAQRLPTYSRGCMEGSAWEVNKAFFGNSHESQLMRRQDEIRAWYDLIQLSDIVSYANVQRDPDRDRAFLQSVMWY